VVDFFSNNLAAITLVLAGLCLLTIVMLQSVQVSRLKRRIDDLTGGVEGGDLESVLGEHLETVHQVGRDLDELTARTAILESAARHHFAHQGLVRFNPFPDTGGNQSFALALLDESDDGYIVSSLHSRTGTRIYAKAVVGGKSDTSLSAEEQEAIDEARAKRPSRPAAPARSAVAGRAAVVPSGMAAPAAGSPARTPSVAAAPAARPVPAQAVPVKSAPAARPAPAPSARPMPATPAAPVQENSNRAASEQAKGQQKSKDAVPETEPAPDAERVGFKPGRPPVSEPRTK
jgi:hypothetical protein